MEFYFNDMHYLFEDNNNPTTNDDEIDVLKNEYFVQQKKLLSPIKIKCKGDYFSSIRFPQLPKQYGFLMMDIDMPKKFNNINGAMELHPRTMVKDEEDIAHNMFGNIKVPQLTLGDMNTSEAYLYNKAIADALLESYVNEGNRLYEDSERDTQDKYRNVIRINDVDPSSPHTEDEQFYVDADAAISSYINTTVARFQECLTLVTSTNQDNAISEIIKTIQEADRYSKNNCKKWLEENNEFLKAIKNEAQEKRMNELHEKNEFNKLITNAISTLATSKKNYKAEDIKELQNATRRDDVIRKAEKLGLVYNSNTEKFSVKTNEGKTIRHNSVLNEAEGAEDRKVVVFDLDSVYEQIYTMIKNKVSAVLTSRPSSWESVIESKKAMDEIIASADTEIKSMIDIVTRTGEGSKDVDMPEKFKNLFFKYPMDGAYLKTFGADIRKSWSVVVMTASQQ